MYYYVYFFDYLDAENKIICTNLKVSKAPDDIIRYHRRRPQVSRETFEEFADAERFIKKMPTYREFFALTDNNFNYLLESDECKDMRKDYSNLFKPAHEAIKILANFPKKPKDN